MSLRHPGEVEHLAFFSAHLGGRFQSAGLRVQFHHNQEPGIHFTIQPPREYADAIINGISDGLTRYFPSLFVCSMN
jgi:hypothetical protein